MMRSMFKANHSFLTVLFSKMAIRFVFVVNTCDNSLMT